MMAKVDYTEENMQRIAGGRRLCTHGTSRIQAREQHVRAAGEENGQRQPLTESSPSVSVSPAHIAPGAVVIGLDQCSSYARPFPFPSSRFLSESARLTPCGRNITPSSVSAPDSSSSSDVGPPRCTTRAYSETAWREWVCDASDEVPGTRRWGDDAARGGGTEETLGGRSGGVSEYGGGLLLGALIAAAGDRRSRARVRRVPPKVCDRGRGDRGAGLR